MCKERRSICTKTVCSGPTYSDRLDTYVCLLLHVLIGNDNQIVIEDEDSESISSLVVERAPDRSFLSSVVKNCFKRDNGTGDMVHDAEIAAGMGQSQKIKIPLIAQHYNPDRRFIYDEAKSMRESNLTVAVEQVSIFLTSDGTLITFFQVQRICIGY